VKVRETEITGWTVFHFLAPLDEMKLERESGRDKNCRKDTGIWEGAQELDGSMLRFLE
jgi:hypothetical protein